MQLMDDIRTPECRQFAEAWQRWRGINIVPRRSDVRIEEITSLLPMASVLEVVSAEVATFRLAGTALCDVMGIELTGLNYFDFTTAEERGPRSARTNQLVNHPAGSHFVFPIVYRTGRLVPSEIVSFPVRPNDPAAPMQLFSLTMSLEDLRLEGRVASSDKLPMPEGFQFVDIGAGVPDKAHGLADRPPAALLVKQAS